jgi:hypothetical protein
MAWIGKRNPAVRGALISAFLIACVVIAAHLVDPFEVIAGWSRQHEEWQAGGLLTANPCLALALAAFAWRRSAERPRGLDERRRAEEALRARE